MKKEEMVHLHLILAQSKIHYEEAGCEFPKYNELDITPFQVHRSKEEHKQAVFVLATELVSNSAFYAEKMKPKDTEPDIKEYLGI